MHFGQRNLHQPTLRHNFCIHLWIVIFRLSRTPLILCKRVRFFKGVSRLYFCSNLYFCVCALCYLSIMHLTVDPVRFSLWTVARWCEWFLFWVIFPWLVMDKKHRWCISISVHPLSLLMSVYFVLQLIGCSHSINLDWATAYWFSVSSLS